MNKLYLVAYTRHNKVSGGTAYKVDFASENIDEAKKKYHALLGEFIANETYDFASVILYDSLGNKYMSEFWEDIATEVTE